MITRKIENSKSLALACQGFLDDLAQWIEHCIEQYGNADALKGHDQGTFTTAWGPHINYGKNGVRALEFMCDLRDKIKKRFDSEGRWRHGYWTMQEAHHGTEHFELFLGEMLRLAPEDEETRRQLLDAAEHIGNWSDAVPPWFNWETGLFHSVYFGADGVDQDWGEFNIPDHFRLVNICLLAWRTTAEQRYLDLAALHSSRWADAILSSDSIPAGISEAGPIRGHDKIQEGIREFVGQALVGSEVDRSENLLASGAINALLDLWKIDGGGNFRAAAEKIMAVIATQIADPDAAAAAALVRAYRKITDDRRYDRFVLEAMKRTDPFEFGEISLNTEGSYCDRPSGIGKRKDMCQWLEDGRPAQIHPVHLAVQAEISADEGLWVRAVDLARTRFLLAREAFPSGRNHGCGARSVSAIARGHGRENNCGTITEVLAPAMQKLSWLAKR